MAVIGKSGKFKIGSSVVVSQINNWKLDLDADMKDITNLDSNGWREFLAGLKTWTGTASGEWNVVTDTTGQAAVQNAWLGSTSLSGEFNVNGTNKYTGTIFIKKLTIEDKVDDTVKFSIDFTGTAALTYA